MKPTRIHYFYAQDWPTKLWFALIMSSCVVAAFRVCEPTLATLHDGRSLLLLCGILAVALAIGFFAALLCGWLILGPLYYDRMLKNGGPFKIGDSVQILAGPHCDRVVRVYALAQGDAVRVELGEEAQALSTDVFAATELLKAEDATGAP